MYQKNIEVYYPLVWIFPRPRRLCGGCVGRKGPLFFSLVTEKTAWQKQKKVAYEKVPLKVEQGSLPNDGAQLASNDSKRAHFITIPFSAETFSAQVLDTKSPTDFLDFFAHLRVKSNEALDVDEIFLEE